MTPPIIAPRDQLAYYDSRSVDLPRAITPLEAWTRFTRAPMPLLSWAFRVRDAISARFGVKRLGGFHPEPRDQVAVGERLGFFLVEAAGPDYLVLTERDRHLDVMTSVTTEGARLTITSSVVTHNAFGRAYMIPVGPAHRLIVNALFLRLRRDLLQATETKGPGV